MLHLGMSADSKKEPVFSHENTAAHEPVRSFSDFGDYILNDDPDADFGRVVIRSGLVVLFGIVLVAGYHFVQDSRTDRQTASIVAPKAETDPPKNEVRQIDLTQTGSIKDTSKLVLERPVPANIDQKSGHEVHIVQPGDTLSAISRKYKLSAKEIIALNNIENPRLIKPGMKLKVSN